VNAIKCRADRTLGQLSDQRILDMIKQREVKAPLKRDRPTQQGGWKARRPSWPPPGLGITGQVNLRGPPYCNQTGCEPRCDQRPASTGADQCFF